MSFRPTIICQIQLCFDTPRILSLPMNFKGQPKPYITNPNFRIFFSSFKFTKGKFLRKKIYYAVTVLLGCRGQPNPYIARIHISEVFHPFCLLIRSYYVLAQLFQVTAILSPSVLSHLSPITTRQLHAYSHYPNLKVRLIRRRIFLICYSSKVIMYFHYLLDFHRLHLLLDRVHGAGLLYRLLTTGFKTRLRE